MRVQGLVFQEIPGGSFIESTSSHRFVPMENFWISRTEADWESWNEFLAECPQWAAENRESLAQQGLVTADYLAFSPVQAASASASLASRLNAQAMGISWHAATAYCQWLSSKLPLEMQNAWEARLPFEREWEYAARIIQEDLEPTRWNWCYDPFAPAPFFAAPEDIIGGISSPDRSLRGGSWINPPGSVNRYTRGSLPPDACSLFVSFKPVIARKRSGTDE